MKIGTKVEVTLDDGKKWITETRSEPWEMCGTMVVQLKGKSGSYDFSRVKAVEPLYYLRNVEKGYVGNSCYWWKDDDRSYTLDIRRAKKFTEQEMSPMLFYKFEGKEVRRSKFKEYPIEHVDCLVQHHIDIQDLNQGRTQPWTMKGVQS